MIEGSNPKILITGGAGFIGANFVHYWVKNHPEWQVRVLDALTYAGNKSNLSTVENDIEFIRGDITCRNDVRRAMEDIDWVVHFAAQTHVDRSIYDPDLNIPWPQKPVLISEDDANKHKYLRELFPGKFND